MNRQADTRHPPAAPGPDGVSVRRTAGGGLQHLVSVLAVLGVLGGLALVWQGAGMAHSRGRGTDVGSVPGVPSSGTPTVPAARAAPAPARRAPGTTRIAQAPSPAEAALDFTTPGSDPDDLAAHFRADDPVPTMGEVIAALREAGVHEGLGAFNPPGTKPLLQGLAVPSGFELPQGYVRHHQVTDQGEDVEPILMFAPDAQLFDARGQPIPLPGDLVVPAELAPPGMPIRAAALPDA